MSTLLKKSKNYATAIVAVLLTIGMMSFNMMTSSTLLEWYGKDPVEGTYVLLNPGSPSAEPPGDCTEEEAEICAKGFIPGQAPSEITDATLAVDRFIREN